jgi:hypothetical protein
MSDLLLYVDREDSLGDFLNTYPVLSGLYNSYGKYNLVIKSALRRFNGIRELLMYQGIFENVAFDDELTMFTNVIILHKDDCDLSGKTNEHQPTDVYKYGAMLKKYYGIHIQIDDNVTLNCPNYDIEIVDNYYVGDRWSHPHRDYRRGSNIMSHLDKFVFMDYSRTLLENCYILKNLKRPFITNLTGIAVLADLLYTDTLVVWKEEDWNPEFRQNGNIVWDDAKDINDIFKRHFYTDRNCKFIHNSELDDLL